ncbi:hypothetical protein AX777_20695 [Sphingobium yanoikuyae]|uniref:Pirin N-terminal domain-containing protein n=2 Tax=Sphingobium yanoikuyae TaxID=13690 RepID=A0A177JTX2_SPHYA|nr:hypothetical protein AX777_20695 [Sphingobium yanoikuyae]
MPHTATRTPTATSVRKILHRTQGRSHPGMPVTRLMSPSDLGEVLKPFVFLDLLDHDAKRISNDPGLHPHSGIATITYIAQGVTRYIDPDGSSGIVTAGGVEWMQAGRGMWHSGGAGAPGRIRGFQLWIALPPELELGPTSSLYQGPGDVARAGPARILLGSYNGAQSAIRAPSPINYLAVTLQAGERWRYDPPLRHSILWAAVSLGAIGIPDRVEQGEMIAFHLGEDSVEFEALTDAEFVLGSAVPHAHDLVLGSYSVHTSPEALRRGEAHIRAMQPTG